MNHVLSRMHLQGTDNTKEIFSSGIFEKMNGLVQAHGDIIGALVVVNLQLPQVAMADHRCQAELSISR